LPTPFYNKQLKESHGNSGWSLVSLEFPLLRWQLQSLFTLFMTSCHSDSFVNACNAAFLSLSVFVVLYISHSLEMPLYRYPFGTVSSPLKSMRSFWFTHQINTVSLIRYTSRKSVKYELLQISLGLNFAFFICVQGTNLRGREFNLTLHWHVMPKTGKMLADKIVMPGYRLPREYRWCLVVLMFLL